MSPKAVDIGVVNVIDAVERIYGIEGEVRGREYVFCCVNPQHSDSRPSCSVNIETGYYHCLACGVGGDLAALGVVVLKRTREEVLDVLAPATIEGFVEATRSRLRAIMSPKTASQSKERPIGGPYEDGPLTAFRQRGFTQETLQKFGVRFVPEEKLLNHKGKEFSIRSSIGIPIRDESGRTMAWCYRRTDSSPDWQPRYLYDREVSHLWFGVDQHPSREEVVVVEGAADTMWVDQCGFPAIGLLGAGMVGGKHDLKSKVLRLLRYKSLILLGDRDAGGESWVRYIGEHLGERMPIRVMLYPSWVPGEDPQDLLGVDLEIMLARAKTWSRFRNRLCTA